MIGVTAGQDVPLRLDHVSSRAEVVSGLGVNICECRGTCQGCEGARCEDWEPPILSPPASDREHRNYDQARALISGRDNLQRGKCALSVTHIEQF